MSQDRTPLLAVTGIRKAFGGVQALRGVDFRVFSGQCVALVGENGAGKSTLMKILSGVWPAGSFEGSLCVDGTLRAFRGPLDARSAGISIIHQELSLFPELTVAENLFLTDAYPYAGVASASLSGRVRRGEMERRAAALFARLGFRLSPAARLGSLPVAAQQLVEIARAFHQCARLVILDEPTSALSADEANRLFSVIARAKGSSTAFVYISHKLDEVFGLADRIVILRDGRSVADLAPSQTTERDVIALMVGRECGLAPAHAGPSETETVLEVRGLSHRGPDGRALIKDVSLRVGRGECLGIAGLMGSGRTEILRSLVGVLPGDRSGEIRYEGRFVHWAGSRDAAGDGVAFVTEDRKRDGLFLGHSTAFNLSIGVLRSLSSDRGGWVDQAAESRLVESMVRRLGIRGEVGFPVRLLSGGNQQKVLLGRAVAASPRLLFLDEPTRGIDVGAKEEIYAILRGLLAEGMSIVLVSSELPEILHLADRVLVVREGKTVGEWPNEGLRQETLMAAAAGAA